MIILAVEVIERRCIALDAGSQGEHPRSEGIRELKARQRGVIYRQRSIHCHAGLLPFLQQRKEMGNLALETDATIGIIETQQSVEDIIGHRTIEMDLTVAVALEVEIGHADLCLEAVPGRAAGPTGGSERVSGRNACSDR